MTISELRQRLDDFPDDVDVLVFDRREGDWTEISGDCFEIVTLIKRQYNSVPDTFVGIRS